MRKVSFNAGVAQLVERHLPKVNVVSSNLITRSVFPKPVRVKFLNYREHRESTELTRNLGILLCRLCDLACSDFKKP